MKILVMHSSFTGGHKAAADALVAALNDVPGVQAESFNTLSTSSDTVQTGQKIFYDVVSNKVPTLRRIGFDLSISGSPVAHAVGSAALAAKAMLSPEVLDKINAEKPDLIVSTHSQTNAMLSFWKERGDLHVPVHSVLTDFLGHAMWAQDNIDHYYVASSSVRRDLQGYGVDRGKISVTGIPVKPAFAQPGGELAEARSQRLGLDPHRKTVLIMGGSLGDQRYAELVGALDLSPYPMQIVAITAKNDAAKAELQAMHTRHPLHVHGYVANVEDWMRASDVVVTKPGGLTASEIFALRKPMVIANPYPGMEEHQTERLCNTGVAFRAQDADDTRACVEAILGDARQAAAIAKRMDLVSHPDAAQVVAGQIVQAARARRAPLVP